MGLDCCSITPQVYSLRILTCPESQFPCLSEVTQVPMVLVTYYYKANYSKT